MNVVPSLPRRQASSLAAEEAFRGRIADLGGTVLGDYVNNRTPVHVACAANHNCYPRPDNVIIGQGACRTCAGTDPETARATFYARVAERGARVVGTYVNAYTPVHVVCADGHDSYPWPTSVQQGRGTCRVCAGRDPATTRAAVFGRVAELGGRVVGPYMDTTTPVHIVCADGHDCYPRPSGILQGQGVCRTCAGKDPAAAKASFYFRISAMSARVVGPYVSTNVPVHVVCAAGHDCYPWPTTVQQGGGVCRRCNRMVWDIFYVVVNPTLGLVKVGVTSLDKRQRLSFHRRHGYADVVRVLHGLTDAHLLERHLLITLRDAGVSPVRGREYFPDAVLAVVLDIVDGWARSTGQLRPTTTPEESPR